MNKDNLSAVELDVSLGREAAGTPLPEDPFRIVILGDFSARESRGVIEDSRAIAARRPLMVDRDNFDEILARLRVELKMPVAGLLRFRELDDFHPDRLVESVPLFARLLEARDSAPGSRPAPKAASPAAAFSFGNLLDDAISATENRAAERATQDPFQAWIEDKVAPHTVTPEPASRAEQRALVDQVMSVQMSAILHYPAFQSLEALWRALFFLVRHAETSSDLSIYLLDVSRQELARDTESGLFRALAQKGDWAVLAGAYSFGANDDELELLARLGAVAARFGGSFLAGAAPSTIGCQTLAPLDEPSRWRPSAPAFEELRRSAVARHIGLLLPGFLLRQPYGARTDACSAFAFEEMGEEFDSSRLLWGNSALAAAALLAQSFSEEGWHMRAGLHRTLDRLPLYVHGKGADSFAAPCAETWMTQEAAEEILDRGPMVVASIKDTDQARLIRFQSIALPPAPLAARWQD